MNIDISVPLADLFRIRLPSSSTSAEITKYFRIKFSTLLQKMKKVHLDQCLRL